jgi:short-subunit dehydrogenase
MIIPEFIKKKAGHIVLIGSIAGYKGMPNSMGYGASKAGIIHLAENLRCDLAKYNIEVQVINPGFVKTRLTDLNDFKMPFIMEPAEAAKAIIAKMQSGSFESHFPFFFANLVKMISWLPNWLYFKILG